MTITDPTDLLKAYLNESVCAGINSGEYIKGRLVAFDEYHNLLIDEESNVKFIRGEIVVFIGQEQPH